MFSAIFRGNNQTLELPALLITRFDGYATQLHFATIHLLLVKFIINLIKSIAVFFQLLLS